MFQGDLGSRLFEVFDKDSSGLIDRTEYVIGLQALLASDRVGCPPITHMFACFLVVSTPSHPTSYRQQWPPHATAGCVRRLGRALGSPRRTTAEQYQLSSVPPL